MSASYREICKILENAGVENADIDAAELISHFCGVERSRFFSPSSEIKDRKFDSDELMRAVEKRAERYPLQYIIGEWDFYRQTYRVSEDCLIPRQDTELIVEKLVELLPRGARFLDLCTGSGCIAISTLAEREDTSASALDLFEKTVALARENAERNRVGERYSVEVGDVFSPETRARFGVGSFDAIVSNPPYIPSRVVSEELAPELAFEPSAALDGGDDGLDFYREIIKNYGSLLVRGGFMLFEIGYDQREALEALARERGLSCRIFCDLGGNDRAALIEGDFR